MLIRREIQLFLWVSALALVGVMFFRGTVYPVSDSGADHSFADNIRGPEADPVEVTPEQEPWSRTLLDAAADSRPLFRVAAPAGAAVEEENAADIAPLLKGIAETDVGLVAVFQDPASGQFRTVGPGDRVGRYEIVAVRADRVSVTSVEGDDVLHLRGAGEHP